MFLVRLPNPKVIAIPQLFCISEYDSPVCRDNLLMISLELYLTELGANDAQKMKILIN